MIDPKLNNNNHIVEDLKEENNEELEENNPISKAIQGFTNKSSDENTLKKKMFRNLLIITAVAILIVVALYIFTSFGGNKTYSEVEDIMINAATKYYQANTSSLPKTTKGTVEVSAKKLANLNYMKDLEKYIKKASCNGKVVVENNDDNYIYIPYLDCGESYKTTELYRKITDSKNIVTTGEGLYNNNGSYIFRGENLNNYVSINEQIWRIVKVTTDNEVVLIKQDRIGYESSTWDDRYNNITKYKTGINDFSVSRVKDSLNKIYKDTKKEYFTDNIKNYIVNHNYCIGKRSINSPGNNNSIECATISEPLKVGILTTSEYMMASLDGNCTNANSPTCQNYNYLSNKKSSWWLITGLQENTSDVFYIENNGSIKKSSASSYKALRPVIYLNSKTMYKSGEGTIDKPYILK